MTAVSRIRKADVSRLADSAPAHLPCKLARIAAVFGVPLVDSALLMRIFALLGLSLLLACAVPAAADLPTDPAHVRPLPVGSAVPQVELHDIEGQTRPLEQVLDGKPALLVFYRGGWCPFCNLQLSELRKLEPELKALGVQLLAISPDNPAHLRKLLDQTALGYTLLSDADASAITAFGVAFEVDLATREKYRTYGIDLEVASGHDHHALPVPSVFLIDAGGVVQFNYSHPDYRTRVPVRLVRAAVEAVVKGETGRPLKR